MKLLQIQQDTFHIRKVAVNTLNKKMQTADNKHQSTRFGNNSP
jgi:hypothetical protein